MEVEISIRIRNGEAFTPTVIDCGPEAFLDCLGWEDDDNEPLDVQKFRQALIEAYNAGADSEGR